MKCRIWGVVLILLLILAVNSYAGGNGESSTESQSVAESPSESTSKSGGESVVATVKKTVVRTISTIATTAATIAESARNFATYTRTHSDTGQTYAGRVSGFAPPEVLVSRRQSTHPPRLSEFDDAVVDQSCSGCRSAIRGREQQLIDHHGGSQSDGGSTANLRRGVAKDNRLGRYFHESSNERWGELHPYTGY